MPRLRRAGSIQIVANGDLHGVYLPMLERAASFEVDGNQMLSTVSAPKLAGVDGEFTVTSNAALEVLNVAALAKAGTVKVAANPKLTLVDGQLPGLVAPVQDPEPTPPVDTE